MANANDVVAAAMQRHVRDANSIGSQSVTYTPRGGDATTIRAVVRFEESVGEFERPDGRTFRGMIELHVDLTECPDIGSGDKFRVGGVDYFVDKVPEKNLGVAHVVAVNLEQREKGTRNRLLPTGG
jgi:hypothetical protein